MRQFWIFIILLSIFSQYIYAITIQGNIYDLNLNTISDVKIDINTTPKQIFISKDGKYTFEVPIGDYQLTAKYYQNNAIVSSASENISVKDEGKFNVDIILFPNFEEEEQLMKEDIEVEGNIFNDRGATILYLILAFILLTVLLVVIFNYNKNIKKGHPITEKEDQINEQELIPKNDVKTEQKEQETIVIGRDLEDIIKIIKEEGGRTTQKEIRKKIPLSEAKISLMIAELESKGIIDKIKKGRGNILILKK